MNQEYEITDVGSAFGNEAVEHVARRAEAYCECERQRIELSNQARINVLNVQGRILAKRERQLETRLHFAVPVGEQRSRRWKARCYWATGIVLTVAAFFFSVIAFAPFRLEWWGILYCLGIAVVTPFAVEEFLDAWKSDKLLKGIVTAVLCAALAGGALLAAVRADLFAEQAKQSSSPAITIDGQAPAASSENAFYESTRTSLRLLMLLLAFAIDLGAGIAVHRALILGTVSGEDAELLLRELREVHERLAAVVCEITDLTNAPGIFVARFWRDFYRAMLTQTARKALTTLLGLSCFLFLIPGCQSATREQMDLLVAVDLSASEAVKGHDEKSQFGKNIEGVAHLLASAPAGSEVTIIGITENSFAQPYILLSARISNDEGYFGERLAAARKQLVRVWEQRAAKLAPTAPGTDIVGALMFASELFGSEPAPRKRILLLYSDMRHVTRELNLETPRTMNVDTIFATLQRQRLFPDLHGVSVHVLGANGDGKELREWQTLRQFWFAYFKRTGAKCEGYSILTDSPKLER